MSGGKINSVFYAEAYHPIQAGSIDGTDIAAHDNAIYRALLCYNARLYDPFGDPKVTGDPYCTVFVGRLSRQTTEETLLKAMCKYGKVKNLRLVTHIVTGASCGYAFVEYETERGMRRAYEYGHHSFIDDSEVIVDYNRQQLMPGWIPRRLGGGLGGRKESGQLRFGGRERPFRAPLRPIPFEDLERLGISPPPEGRYMSRFQIPSPPSRKRNSVDGNEDSSDLKDRFLEHERRRSRERSISRDNLTDERKSSSRKQPFDRHRKHSNEHEKSASDVKFRDEISLDAKESSQKRHDRRSYDEKSYDRTEHSHGRQERSTSQDHVYVESCSVDGKERSHRHLERSNRQDYYSNNERSSLDTEEGSHKSRKNSEHDRQHDRKHSSKYSSRDLKHSKSEKHSRKHNSRSRHSYERERSPSLDYSSDA